MCCKYTIRFIILFSGLLHAVRDSFDFSVLNFWQFGKNLTFVLDLDDRNMKQLLKSSQRKKSENHIDFYSGFSVLTHRAHFSSFTFPFHITVGPCCLRCM